MAHFTRVDYRRGQQYCTHTMEEKETIKEMAGEGSQTEESKIKIKKRRSKVGGKNYS